MTKTFSEWLAYIGQIHVSAIDLGLERMLPVATTLKLTQFSCPVITVGGTNGKGSVVCTLEQIYLAAGYRVAAYTSPHLLRFNERLRINGEVLADETWQQAFAVIEAARKHCSLSFFEYTTLAALWICQQHSLDILVLEVGLGGRLDAVNVVDAMLAVVTNIAIDHVDWLGDDREKIAFEKAGIFRTNGMAVCGDPNPPQSLLQVAQQHGVRLFCFEKDYFFKRGLKEWQWIGPNRHYSGLALPHLKLQNVATAIMATELIDKPITAAMLQQGVALASLPGRYETVFAQCKVIFDVAHNTQATHYLLERFTEETVSGRRCAVVGMLRDKEVQASLLPFIGHIDQWYVASLAGPRGASAVEIAQILTENGAQNCYSFDSVAAAFRAALSESKAEDSVLVFGSFHTVGEAKELLASC